MRRNPIWNRIAALVVFLSPANLSHADSDVLPGTQPLRSEGDIASELVAGVDRFLLRKLDESESSRSRYWKRDYSSPDAYGRSLETNRRRLAHILGMRDKRNLLDSFEFCSSTAQTSIRAEGDNFRIHAIRWNAFDEVFGEGLLLTPKTGRPAATVIAIPDAAQSPEQLVGLIDGVPPESQYARRLAESGCRVIVPVLIDRQMEKRLGRANLTNREYLYRSAFELGRHIIGYELQKVLSVVDVITREKSPQPHPIGVFGWGEGGLLALYAGAIDPRIQAVGVSGSFGDNRKVWQEPIDRNVFGLVDAFGTAELAAMIAPRTLIVEACRGPELRLPGQGGAPAKLATASENEVRRELDRLKAILEPIKGADYSNLVIAHFIENGNGAFAAAATLQSFLSRLGDLKLSAAESARTTSDAVDDRGARMRRQILAIDRHNQKLLTDSPYVRNEFMKRLDYRSLDQYKKSTEYYREYFANEVIGRFDDELLPPQPRSRKTYDNPKWTGYEIVLDVFPDVIAYGVLLVPKDMASGEKRPVVVCQHGLEGRPRDTIVGNNPAYHDFAAKLAERGFITFAPQNLYLFTDRFRTLQRKANPLKKTLFSIIVPQHQQITRWLKSLPFVDGERIAFYGLSYGGKTAMRVPPLVQDYCLSICSADFGDWVWKNASTRSPYSYVWTGEYEIFEWDLGSTFNYAEMAALIAPRPFMVERGHFDGVQPDETVAYEFAKVRFLYQAKLSIGDRSEIEFFVGPHTINGRKTFEFLHRHLRWPAR